MERRAPAGWQATIARTTYSAACTALTPALLPLLALHPRLSGGLGQRLGQRAPGSRQRAEGSTTRPLWLHGSSAGDVAALVPLVSRLEELGFETALSAWTRTGHQMASLRCGKRTEVFRAPLDLAGPVEAVLDRVGPGCLVLECLEMWPQLVNACHQRQIPVAVVNGRLSPASLATYRRLRWLFEPCFSSLSLVTALTPNDARRFEEAGTPGERIRVMPSSKHGGAAPQGPPPDPGQRLVLGSLHEAEEELLFPWIPRLLARAPALQVVVAPRYPHRAPAVQRKLRAAGLRTCMLSRGEPPAGAVTIVDTMGQLAGQYRGARVAFVGGSLFPRGGHNVVEPAALGVPVLVGPHTANCAREVAMMLAEGAAMEVQDGRQFYEHVQALLMDRRRHSRASGAGLLVASRLASAADELVSLLLDIACQA